MQANPVFFFITGIDQKTPLQKDTLNPEKVSLNYVEFVLRLNDCIKLLEKL